MKTNVFIIFLFILTTIVSYAQTNIDKGLDFALSYLGKPVPKDFKRLEEDRLVYMKPIRTNSTGETIDAFFLVVPKNITIASSYYISMHYYSFDSSPWLDWLDTHGWTFVGRRIIYFKDLGVDDHEQDIYEKNDMYAGYYVNTITFIKKESVILKK